MIALMEASEWIPMARKRGKSRYDDNAPGSLNEENMKAWTDYLAGHSHGPVTRETIREIFAAFKASRLYKTPHRPPPLPPPLRPWDDSEVLTELATAIVESIRAGRLSDLSSRDPVLPFIPDIEIGRIVTACLSRLESGQLSAGASQQVRDFLSAVKTSTLNRGTRAWNTIGHNAYFK